VFVPSDRTAAILDPSGDQVGNPYIPSDVSSRRVELPSAATTEIDPSSARTAMEPVDPIGPPDAAELGAALGAPLAEAEGVTADRAALGDGVVVAQAAARSAVTAIARTGRARDAIT
jgi:hypothetical protein